MTTDHSLDEKIRSCVLEIVDSAPPAPVLQLDQLGTTVHPWWTPRRTAVVLGGLVIAISVIVVASLLVAEGSSQEVSEVQLGLQLTSRVATTQPVAAGQDRVATGTFFGHPWLVSGINTFNTPGGILCEGFSYRGSVLQGGGACVTTSSKIPTPPPWTRSVWVSSLRTASDGQRFLVAVTNSTVTKLTVRAPGGTFVSASPLAEHLGNASFFVLSLGRERGPCYGLCLGSVTYSLSTPSGPTLIDQGSSMVIQDKGGEVMPLSAPVRG